MSGPTRSPSDGAAARRFLSMPGRAAKAPLRNRSRRPNRQLKNWCISPPVLSEHDFQSQLDISRFAEAQTWGRTAVPRRRQLPETRTGERCARIGPVGPIGQIEDFDTELAGYFLGDRGFLEDRKVEGTEPRSVDHIASDGSEGASRRAGKRRLVEVLHGARPG